MILFRDHFRWARLGYMARGPTDGLEGRTLLLGRLGTERCAHMIKSYGGGGTPGDRGMLCPFLGEVHSREIPNLLDVWANICNMHI